MIPGSGALLTLYVIYGRPLDYPDEFVVRRWDGMSGSQIDQGLPFARGSTLPDVRAGLPAGLFNLGRDRFDDPTIVEVWI